VSSGQTHATRESALVEVECCCMLLFPLELMRAAVYVADHHAVASPAPCHDTRARRAALSIIPSRIPMALLKCFLLPLSYYAALPQKQFVTVVLPVPRRHRALGHSLPSMHACLPACLHLLQACITLTRFAVAASHHQSRSFSLRERGEAYVLACPVALECVRLGCDA